jgi:glycosyltransferase involved in cell wall biosynthesis
MRTHAIITVGAQVAKALLEREIGQPEQFTNIPPGVEPLKLPKAKPRAKVTIGWIARVTGVKNPLRVLEVAKLFPNAQFLIAGGGDLLDQVRAQAPKNTKVLGWTDAAKLFAASDIILSTSENEGMPVALIEAQLAGKPVVATDAGSVSEVLLNHETGIVTNKNAGSIALALESLLLDKQKRTEMGTLAISRAHALFSVDRMINAHITLYKSIVK